MPMTSYTDLIDRLEKATGPSLELDGLIWCAVNGYEFVNWDGAGCIYRIAGRHGIHHISHWAVRPYSASLDAALSLVSPDAYWMFARGRTTPDEPLYAFQILDPASGALIDEAEHENREICVLLAALRARSAQEER